LVEKRLSLALTNKEDRFLQVASSLLCEINPENAKQFMINSLATSGNDLCDYTRGHFSKLLGEFGGSESRLLLIGQLMQNRPTVSKAAYNSLVSMGWTPSSQAESALAALYKPDHQAFESLGEEALPHVLAFMAGREKCGLSILSYILRVVSQQELDQTLIRTILQAEWEYEAYRELPKLLAFCPDITTEVLLELIPKQWEGTGDRIRFTEYLSAVGNDKAIPLFITLLSSKYEHEIKLAAMALGRLRHEPAIPLLGTALPNIRDKATYSAIVKAIAAIGGEQAVELLRPLLPDLQTKVLRNAAEKAIAKWEKTRSRK
jgi:HEAT repeat protein